MRLNAVSGVLLVSVLPSGNPTAVEICWGWMFLLTMTGVPMSVKKVEGWMSMNSILLLSAWMMIWMAKMFFPSGLMLMGMVCSV